MEADQVQARRSTTGASRAFSVVVTITFQVARATRSTSQASPRAARAAAAVPFAAIAYSPGAISVAKSLAIA